jgi:N-acyl-D-amino-acid deacylase
LTTRELIEMAKAIAPYGGIYAAHMRDESQKLLSAIEEMIAIGEQANVPVEIFHFKNAFAPHWGTEIHRAIDLINTARSRGVDIAADQYPYTAGGSGIDATIPRWLWEEGFEQGLEKLRDPDVRVRLKKEIADPRSSRMVNNSGGWSNITLANAFSDPYKKYHNKSFVEIGKVLKKDPADAAWDIMLQARPNRAYALYHMMSEDDVKTIMKQPWVSIGSDAGAAEALGEVDAIGLPHPRAYGTFARIIAKYVRDDGLLSLEDAIRKMTSLPARRMRLKDRGVIREQAYADLVIFDYEKIQDRATWEEPLRTPTGIDYVLVNGVVVAEKGIHTGKVPGKVLYGPGYEAND